LKALQNVIGAHFVNNKSFPRYAVGNVRLRLFFSAAVLSQLFVPYISRSQTKPFHLLEATTEDIQSAYRSGQLTARQLV
jgi:hypothetical protein